MYPIKSLASKCGVSEQSIRNLLKNNTELSQLSQANTSKNGRFINYGQPVLDWLLNYYKVDFQQLPTGNDAGGSIVEPEKEETPQPTPPQEPVEDDLRVELIKLRVENEALKTAVEGLKSDLERERAEKADLNNKLGMTLLALRDEQAEKKLYLPAPKKSLGQRLKGLFSKKPEE